MRKSGTFLFLFFVLDAEKKIQRSFQIFFIKRQQQQQQLKQQQ